METGRSPRESPGDAVPLHLLAVEMNEALVLGAVRQHERTEAAEELNEQLRKVARELEEKARLLDLSEDAIVVSGPDHRTSYWNKGAEKLYGWRSEEVLGTDHHLLLQTEFSRPRNEVEAEFQQEGVFAGEVIQVARDGRRITAFCRWILDRETASILASFTDVTERKRQEQHSLHSQRMESIGTLAGGIAHDLNNSLGPIVMSLGLLKMKVPDPATQELLGMIEVSAQRAADMVRQVLSFSRGVEGRRVEVQVADLVQEIERIVNETFLRTIQVQTTVPSGLWWVLGDATQLHQVLLNLCLNARDAMPNGGRISISVQNYQLDRMDAELLLNSKAKPGPYIRLEVKDSGTGIPPHILNHIFDPYFTTKEFGKGSGLGLSTSLAIVKSHGGFIQVASEMGGGTTFQILIPAQVQVAPEEGKTPPPRLAMGKGEVILVVDDDVAMRRTLRYILETFGYRVFVASDGAEALAIYARQRSEIAAVLTDMTMPAMEGPELIRHLRNMNPELPIIGASGLTSAPYESQLALLGVKHFLSKPFTSIELLGTVKIVLEGAGAGKSAS